MPAIVKTLGAKITPAPAETVDGALADPPGTFEALVSVFGNEDRDGDVVEAGAFTDTLAEWSSSGDPLPAMWSHQRVDLNAVIGYYSHWEETDTGLLLKGHLDLDHAPAQRVWELMKRRLIKEFSWSGEVLEYEFIEPEDDSDWWWPSLRMHKIDLWEAGPCFKGSNPATELISIKASDNAGRLGERIRAQASTDNTSAEHLRELAERRQGSAKTAEESDPTPEDDVDEVPVDDTSVRADKARMKARALLELIDT